MASSYRTVNYSLRPAKAVERKMLCEMFRRLEPFARIDTYRYVGLGSIYFTDFQLFHQVLSISDMVSIEKEEGNWPRFEFNIPFRCVDLKKGHTNSILPALAWDKRTIAWLDYDGKLDAAALADLATFCSKAVSGSIILMSVNVTPDRAAPGTAPNEQDEFRLRAFTEAVGEGKVPIGLTGAQLRGSGFEATCRRVFNAEIHSQLNARNGPLGENQKFVYRQLINIRYADDAEMMTIGGLLYEKQHESLADACALDELSFVRKLDEPLPIVAPKLTQKEIRFLNAQLPKREAENVRLSGIPATDVSEYSKIYRYYPSFGEVLLG